MFGCPGRAQDRDWLIVGGPSLMHLTETSSQTPNARRVPLGNDPSGIASRAAVQWRFRPTKLRRSPKFGRLSTEAWSLNDHLGSTTTQELIKICMQHQVSGRLGDPAPTPNASSAWAEFGSECPMELSSPRWLLCRPSLSDATCDKTQLSRKIGRIRNDDCTGSRSSADYLHTNDSSNVRLAADVSSHLCGVFLHEHLGTSQLSGC